MSEKPEVDVHYELIVLRGPDPLKEGVVKGGVIGDLVVSRNSLRKFMIAVAVAILGGVGSIITWVWLAGDAQGARRTREEQLRKDVDRCLRHIESGEPTAGSATTPP